MASGLDEENASMDAVIDNVHSVNLVLSIQVGVVTLFDVVYNGSPRLVIVDKVSETRRVNDS